MRALFTAILAALLSLNSFLFSQINPDNAELFNLDVLNFYSPEGTRSRVDVYIEIPLKNMEFKKSKTEKNSYFSKFDINIDVFNKDKELVFNNLSKEVLTTKETGQEYLSRNSQILTRNLFLPPGEYDLIVSIFEHSTKKKSEIKRKVKAEDYTTPPLTISNVMIVSKISTSEGKKIITPEVQRNVGTVDTFFLFFYVYKNNDDMSVLINCRVLDPDKKEFYTKKETIEFASGSIVQSQVFVAVPTADMGFGKYTVEITASSLNYSAEASSAFENVSPDFPSPLKNIDELIEQLQYIAKHDELEHMRDGKTDMEKQKHFLEFWKKKDPSPNTKRNEVMQEYYKRMINANKFFSTTYTPGWKTDMGMVYVIFGEPSNIERHPYDMDAKPYEIWDYYGDNLQFVFVDNTGFGDYRLITPIWDTFRFENR